MTPGCEDGNKFWLPEKEYHWILNLLVANFSQVKWSQNAKILLIPYHIVTHDSTQQELSNEYRYDRAWFVFKESWGQM